MFDFYFFGDFCFSIFAFIYFFNFRFRCSPEKFVFATLQIHTFSTKPKVLGLTLSKNAAFYTMPDFIKKELPSIHVLYFTIISNSFKLEKNKK